MPNSPTKPTLGKLTGVVSDFEYTSGGAGNQWTIIDGIRYATWWNVSTTDWRRGDKVSFEAYMRPLRHGQPPVLCAQSIRKSAEWVTDASGLIDTNTVTGVMRA